MLQVSTEKAEFVSDYFDFSIYVDADEADVREWYVQRFFALRETVFQDPNSFFRHFAHLTDEEARATAEGIWDADQRPQPQREHPPDPGAGVADPAQGGRPPRLRGPPAQAVRPAGRRQPDSVGRGRSSRSATPRSPMTSTVSSGCAPPQHHQQVVGRPAHRGVALGVLARDDVGAVGVVVTSHSPSTSVQCRWTLPSSGGGVRRPPSQEVEQELVDAVGRQLGRRCGARAGRPLGVERWTAVSWAIRRTTKPTSCSLDHVHTGVAGSVAVEDVVEHPAPSTSAKANTASSVVRARRLDVRRRGSSAARRRSCPRSGAPRRCARRGRPPSIRAGRHAAPPVRPRGRPPSSAGRVAAQRRQVARSCSIAGDRTVSRRAARPAAR